MKIAIIGRGAVGEATKEHLEKKGCNVLVYDRNNMTNKDKLKKIEERDYIFVCAPANEHKNIAKILTKYLTNQIIVLHPGHTFGAIEFYNIIKNKDVKIVEFQTSAFNARMRPEGVLVKFVKNNVEAACLPSNSSKTIMFELQELIDNMRPVENVLQTSINNMNAVIHVAAMIMNKERVQKGEQFHILKEGMTEMVAKKVEKVDNERMRIAKKAGINAMSLKSAIDYCFGINPKNIFEFFRESKIHDRLAPKNLDYRYITEDVPTGLVPFSSLASLVKVKTPVIDSLIEESNRLTGRDFWKEGRTLKNVGLANMNMNEIKTFVNHGLK